MATDLWPDADGLIADGFTIGFAYADSTSITANYPVMVGAHAASRVAVTIPTLNEGFGVALKTPVAVGDMIPVCTYGIVKMTTPAAAAADYPVIGNYVVSVANTGVSNVRTMLTTNLKLFNGASATNVLGLALQTCTAVSDEFLVLVGKCI